jgi:Rod binding domain-containing protein
MKIGPLHPTTTFDLASQSATQEAQTQKTQAKAQAGQVGEGAPIDPEKLRLAREFEQIFIRKMLSSLEKSGRNAAGSSASASGDAYGSMVVSALAEAVSKGGGVGLAEMIARAASQPTAAEPASKAAPAPAPAIVSQPTTATYPRPAPAVIINETHDIQDSFKDRNR